IMYKDEYFGRHKWIWDGKPHWAYNTAYMNLVSDRNAIEWTPNTIATKVSIEGNIANIQLYSNTPNFKTYQMKELPDGNWKNVSDHAELFLEKPCNELLFHSVNLAGVTGPEHKIVIERDKF